MIARYENEIAPDFPALRHWKHQAKPATEERRCARHGERTAGSGLIAVRLVAVAIVVILLAIPLVLAAMLMRPLMIQVPMLGTQLLMYFAVLPRIQALLMRSFVLILKLVVRIAVFMPQLTMFHLMLALIAIAVAVVLGSSRRRDSECRGADCEG